MSGTNAWTAELILVAAPWKASQFYPAGTAVLSAIDIPSWTTATRPSSPNIGRTGFNTTLGLQEQWNGLAWQQYSLSGGSLVTGITAAGSTQGTATALTGSVNVVATVAANTGVLLPTSGLVIEVLNRGANTLNVYPPVSGIIETMTANTPALLVTGGGARYINAGSGQWYVAS